jgi:archaellum component FlaC
MDIDERLERLTERHEALTQTVELLTKDLSDMRVLVNDIRGLAGDIAEGTARLLHVAETARGASVKKVVMSEKSHDEV